MTEKAPKKFLLKDRLFNKERVSYLATRLLLADTHFDQQLFVQDVLRPFVKLEFKERIDWIVEQLHKHLSGDYSEQLSILLVALPEPLDPNNTDNDFGDFIFAPVGYFVSRYGCTEEYFDVSMEALREITMRFSAEGPLRAFIDFDPEKTFAYLERWVNDDNYHVRRLCSEGTRPKLPWAPKINVDYTYGLGLLDQLFMDSTPYVIRSVANHLNDISKKDPTLVIEILKRWKATDKQSAPEMKYIIRHACRTLLKQGDKEALRLLGYTAPKVSLEILNSPAKVVFGQWLMFDCCITSHTDQNLLVNYQMTFPRKKGFGKKVYLLKKIKMKKGEVFKGHGRYQFKPLSTRAHYLGNYHINVVVNGEVQDSFPFVLVE
jgi:3-methyladenine DNA glycosylase AlkC